MNRIIARLNKTASSVYTLISRPLLMCETDDEEYDFEDDNIYDDKIQALNSLLDSEINRMGKGGLAAKLNYNDYDLEKGIIENISISFDGKQLLTKIQTTRDLTGKELQSLKQFVTKEFNYGLGETFCNIRYYKSIENLSSDKNRKELVHVNCYCNICLNDFRKIKYTFE